MEENRFVKIKQFLLKNKEIRQAIMNVSRMVPKNNIIATTLSRNTYNLHCVPYESKNDSFYRRIINDSDLALICIKDKPIFIKYISSFLSNNPLFVIRCCSENGEVYSYLSKKYKYDINIIRASIVSNPSVYKLIPTSIKNNVKISLLAVKLDVRNVNYLHERLLDNRDIALFISNNSYTEIFRMNSKFIRDKEIVNNMVNHPLFHLSDMPFVIRDDIKICKKAINENITNISYITDRVSKILISNKNINWKI